MPEQCAGAENRQRKIRNKLSATQNRELSFSKLPAGENRETYYGKSIKVEKQGHTGIGIEKIVPEQKSTKKIYPEPY